ncbi:MAG: class I SAM-dependent methyltransferase [Actinobacteria bacterium]|nr:class I SAM-dependent methyltransferase [Actinomycetota bacterium]
MTADDAISDPTSTLAEFWERRYAGSSGVWSGRVNPAVREVASGLTPGRALDLGCGEGGDAVWLAQHGWTVTGVDVSATAIARADAAAEAAGISPRSATFIADNLARWEPEGTFDFVTSAFLHSWPVEIPREHILRRGRDAVAPGGSLLILAHAEAPPWANPTFTAHAEFPSPEKDLEVLNLNENWFVERCGTYDREACGPDGQRGVVRDSVVLVRRGNYRCPNGDRSFLRAGSAVD